MTGEPLYVVVETAPCGRIEAGFPGHCGRADEFYLQVCHECLGNGRRFIPGSAESVERVEARSSDPRAVFYRTPKENQ